MTSMHVQHRNRALISIWFSSQSLWCCIFMSYCYYVSAISTQWHTMWLKILVKVFFIFSIFTLGLINVWECSWASSAECCHFQCEREASGSAFGSNRGSAEISALSPCRESQQGDLQLPNSTTARSSSCNSSPRATVWLCAETKSYHFFF